MTADEARALIAKWRELAAASDRDGDFCCAITREHDADDLEAALRVVAPQQEHDIRAALEDAAQNNHQRQHDDSDLWRFHKTESWRDCDDHECKRYRDVLATAVDQEIEPITAGEIRTGLLDTFAIHKDDVFYRLKARAAAVDPPPDKEPKR